MSPTKWVTGMYLVLLFLPINNTNNICTSSLTNLEHPMGYQIRTYVYVQKRKGGYNYAVINQQG